MTKDNHQLGTFTLHNIRKAPKGEVKLDVIFDIDVNGILKVTAVEKGTDNKGDIVIENTTGRLTKEEIEKMVHDAEIYAEQDKEAKATADAKVALESYLNSVKTPLTTQKN